MDSTPLLIVTGERDTDVTPHQAHASLELYKQIQSGVKATLSVVSKPSNAMISSEAEMRLIMQFFSEHLSFRHIELEGRDDLIPVPLTSSGHPGHHRADGGS